MKERSLPEKMIDTCRVKILLVTQDQNIIKASKQFGTADYPPKVRVSTSGFGAAMDMYEWHPDCSIFDYDFDDDESGGVKKEIIQTKRVLLGIESVKNPIPPTLRLDMQEIFKKPFDTQLLTKRVEILLRDA